VTKRRPSWSEQLRWAAALIGGLLLNLAGPTVAAEQQPVASKSGKKTAVRAAAPKAGKAASPAREEIETAELSMSAAGGLSGSASFYGGDFHGRRTATGEVFDARRFTAASNRFPLGSWVAVRRLDNGRCAIVKVNDRMHSRHKRRVIDISRSAAEHLDMIKAGVVLVRVALLAKGPLGDNLCQSSFDEEDALPALPAADWRSESAAGLPAAME
jgi:rare lipoprotein A